MLAYLLRKPRKNGAPHLVMTPVQCLARIAAIIPPPRFPLLRFAGVLAPGSSDRVMQRRSRIQHRSERELCGRLSASSSTPGNAFIGGFFPVKQPDLSIGSGGTATFKF
jgi:Putative transposase